MKKQLNTKSGFTIIEVVLVLAIAGLIFLMVFLALPNLQRSQRDTQRRDDLARYQTAITQYQTNNRGKLPGNSVDDWGGDGTKGLIANYLKAGGDTFTDPDGSDYVIGSVCTTGPNDTATECKDKSVNGDQDFAANEHRIYVFLNAVCDGEKVVKSTGARKVAIQYKMEGGGWYCGNN